MHKFIRTLAAAVALGTASVAQAAIIDFDTPVTIGIDNDTGIATYSEDGFALTGLAGGFGTIDGLGTARSPGLVLFVGNTISLMAVNGGVFSFNGLDAGTLDGGMATMLQLTGRFGGITTFTSTVNLAELASFNFSALDLNELRLSASADVVLDNLLVDGTAAIPEPGTAAMLLLGVGALIGARRRVDQKVKGKATA